MRVPNIERSPGLMQAIGIFLVGFIAGCVAITIVERDNYQLVLEENIQLRSDNARLNENVASLERLKNRRNVIKKTNVIFENKELDKQILSELEARITKDLEFAVGNPVSVDLSLYRALVDGHEYRDIKGANYRIRVTMLAVNQSELSVFVRVFELLSN
jgi:hypothetical protein